MELLEKLKILKNFAFLKNLSEKNLALFVKQMFLKKIPSGEIFIKEEDENNDVYFIYQGFVRIFRMNEQGKEIGIAVLGPGETIGEMSAIMQEKRTANCQAKNDVGTLVLSGNIFREIVHGNAEIAFALLKTFSERLNTANKNLEEILSTKLKPRTWRLLQRLTSFYPDKKIDISQEEIAEILSATRPRVSEVLQELEKEGKIKVSRNQIQVSRAD